MSKDSLIFKCITKDLFWQKKKERPLTANQYSASCFHFGLRLYAWFVTWDAESNVLREQQDNDTQSGPDHKATVATGQGVVLVSCHLAAREGFDASIDPLLRSVLCDVFKMAKRIGYGLVWRNIKRIPPKPVNPKGNQPGIFIGRTDATAESPILWPPDAKNHLFGKDPEAGKDRARGEGDNRGREGWMASPAQWTWVWANSSRKLRTGQPCVLQFMESRRVGHDLASKQQQCNKPSQNLVVDNNNHSFSLWFCGLAILSGLSYDPSRVCGQLWAG